MKDSPMKNTSYWKGKHSESSDASALKFKEGGYTSHGPGSVSPLKELITAAMAAIQIGSMIKGAITGKKSKYKQAMSAAGSQSRSGATMNQGISAGPKSNF